MKANTRQLPVRNVLWEFLAEEVFVSSEGGLHGKERSSVR